MQRLSAGKVAVGVVVVGAILVVVAANWHLVAVAIRSQPECVAHIRLGEPGAGDVRYGAARSACRPAPGADGRQ